MSAFADDSDLPEVTKEYVNPYHQSFSAPRQNVSMDVFSQEPIYAPNGRFTYNGYPVEVIRETNSVQIAGHPVNMVPIIIEKPVEVYLTQTTPLKAAKQVFKRLTIATLKNKTVWEQEDGNFKIRDRNPKKK